jgi:lysophospholipase L1-like esterase
MTLRHRFLALAALAACSALAFAQGGFYLKDGDRVVFYGDSITDQRLYTTFVETFVVTRFPKLNVIFVHSGWGGDRVTGGAGGGIDLRLERDVLPYRPTVVTIMLGMNDGRYRPFDERIFGAYSRGTAEIVRRLREAIPGLRITLIRPSPYDEVTREPMSGGGYNPVLVKFGDFLADLARKQKLDVADLNAPVVAVLEKAKAADPALAPRIVADRVHPGPGGHLIMAGGLLKAWNAPATVCTREVRASGGEALSWTQTDPSLPMPIDMEDPVVALAVKSSDFVESFNQQPLKVTGLTEGYWALRIDGRQVGVFPARQWAEGVNLALLPTPMAAQAAEVHALTLKHNNIHFARWRSVEVPLAQDDFGKTAAAIEALDALEAEIVARQRARAQPVPHRYELVPSDAAAAALPPGFVSTFNGRDRTGWHVSQVNHHGQTEGWTVENGVLKGTQDKPGHGGILLTDKRYRNFEIMLEVNPDFGCDSGLFLRSTEKGEAYQVLLDYLEGGSIGGIYGEALKGVRGGPAENWQKFWKKGEWNLLRARIEGVVPRIQVWLNGARITDWTDTANHLPGGETGGMIAVQVHGGTRWTAGGFHRFRNIWVRELP